MYDLVVVFGKHLVSCTFLTNPQPTLTDSSDPNMSDPMDFPTVIDMNVLEV